MNPRSAQPSDEVIGANIRTRRLLIKMSQETLGGRLGVSFQQVQKYEKGTNRVSGGRLVKIAEALDTTPQALLGLDDKAAPTSSEITLLNFLASKEGVAIIRAFAELETAAKKIVVNLAEDLLVLQSDWSEAQNPAAMRARATVAAALPAARRAA